MISILIPSYRNPIYLSLCLDSILDCQTTDNEIMVVVDGFEEEYKDIIPEYKEMGVYFATPNHLGFNAACNLGVTIASSDKILLLNEDNIVSPGFDSTLEYDFDENRVLSVQQVEPYASSFHFIERDYGTTAKAFEYERWMKESIGMQLQLLTRDAYTFPLFFSKERFLAVNGFDTIMGTFGSDLDLYWRWQTLGMTFLKTHKTMVYHFVSKSTKYRDGGALEDYYKDEMESITFFGIKHGFVPTRNPVTNEVCSLRPYRKDYDGEAGSIRLD